MIPLFTSSQVREADSFASNTLKIPGIILMENASINIYRSIRDHFIDLDQINPIGILCGKGNNGGDGFAVARHFINNGFNVIIILAGLRSELKGDAKTNCDIVLNLIELKKSSNFIEYKNGKDLKKLSECSLIIDALLGTGTKGELREPYKSIIQKVNKLNSGKAAIDIPSGLNVDDGNGEIIFNSDLTVTLAELKRGLYFNKGYINSGRIKKGSIGIGSEYFDELKVEDYLIEPEDVYFSLPKREINAHKYSSGKVLVIAGSGKMPGAACFTANASTKIGAGSMFLAFPESVKSVAQEKLEVGVVYPYRDEMNEVLKVENLDELESRLKWAGVIAVGPGLGREEKTQAAVKSIIKKYSKKNLVIDADGIYALRNGKYKELDLSNSILTPHYKEYADLVGKSVEEVENNLFYLGKKFSFETGAYLVLKGAPTIIFTPKGESIINTAGNAGMAKFGTGDVLTGLIAGLLSQHGDRETAAVSGVYIHSLSADLLKNKFTELGYSANDLLNNIPVTLKFLENSFV
ncbi:MAG: NAD(P)H-hydrate dehydratase [Melioribacteraceae bacterium]|nr:NAD(P)H-hydrate dehydratase [Melioribacteraceae bacterium]